MNRLWITLLLLLLVGVGTPSVCAATMYDVTFSGCSFGTCTLALPTAPPVSFPDPTLMISWGDATFSIALPGETPTAPNYSWQGLTTHFSATVNGPETIFNIRQGQNFFEGTVNADPSGVGFENDGGTITFTPVSSGTSTPEPSTWALMLLGIGLVSVRVVRSARSLPRAT
jgi:hypothetical protein